MGGETKWFSATAEVHCRVDEKRERAHNGWMTFSRKRKMKARALRPSEGRQRAEIERGTCAQREFPHVCNRALFVQASRSALQNVRFEFVKREGIPRYRGGSMHEASHPLLFVTMANGNIAGAEIAGRESRALSVRATHGGFSPAFSKMLLCQRHSLTRSLRRITQCLAVEKLNIHWPELLSRFMSGNLKDFNIPLARPVPLPRDQCGSPPRCTDRHKPPPPRMRSGFSGVSAAYLPRIRAKKSQSFRESAVKFTYSSSR